VAASRAEYNSAMSSGCVRESAEHGDVVDACKRSALHDFFEFNLQSQCKQALMIDFMNMTKVTDSVTVTS
jgi:hypothetical protein